MRLGAIRPLAVALGAAACLSDPTGLRRHPPAEGTPYRLFPEREAPVDTSYRWLGAAVPADPAAPECALPARPPASWRPLRAAVRSRYVDSLEIVLPPTVAARDRVRDLPPDADAEAMGAILVAAWEERAAAGAPAAGRALHVAAWVGPEDGYPTVGADTAARQVRLAECQGRADPRHVRIAEFTLRGPRGEEEYVAAVWRVAPGRYLRALATGFDAGRRAEVRSALATVRVTPHARAP